MSNPIYPLKYEDGQVLQSTVVDPFSQYSHLKTGWKVDTYINDVDITVNGAARTLSISPQGSEAEYWIAGERYTFNGTESVVWDNLDGTWYFYFEPDNLIASQNPWDFDDTKAPVAALYWDASNSDVLTWSPETHSWVFPNRLNSYLHGTFGTRLDEGLETTINASTVEIDVEEGVLFDEDQRTPITYAGAGGKWDQILRPLTTFKEYREGTSADWKRTATANSTPVVLSSNVPQVNTWNGTAYTLTDAGVGQYFAYWVVASTSGDGYPIYMVVGQSSSGTLADALADNSLSNLDTNNVASQEHKILSRVIMQRQAASPYYSIEQVDDYRFTRDDDPDSSSGSATTDHGALTGLLNDDHTQYILADGTRDFTGPVNGVTPTANEHLATKQYVDDNDSDTTNHSDLTNLSADDHIQYVLADGTRAFTGTVTAPGIGASSGNLEVTSTVNFSGISFFNDTVNAASQIGYFSQIVSETVSGGSALTGIANSSGYSFRGAATLNNNSNGGMYLETDHFSTTNGAYSPTGLTMLTFDTVSSGVVNSGTLYGSRAYTRLSANTVGDTQFITGFLADAGIFYSTSNSAVTQLIGFSSITRCQSANSSVGTMIVFKGNAVETAGSVTDKWGLYLTGDEKNRFDGGIAPGVFTDATRPAASSMPTGAMIFNTDDNAPNFASGANWYDATGSVT